MPNATQAHSTGAVTRHHARALEAELWTRVWAATDPSLPPRLVHPLGGHRPRVPDRLCLWAVLIHPATDASLGDVEAILDHQASDTTLRARRDEWIAAGVFEQWASRRSPRSTASSDSTALRSPSSD